MTFRRRRLALLAAAVAVAAANGPAAAAPPELQGLTCGYTFASTPAGWAGEIDGGPIAAVSADVASLTLTCSIVAGPSYGHGDAPVVTASASGSQAAVLPPTPFAGPLPGRTLGMCTRVSLTMRDGTTHELYYDADREEFTTDPGVSCATVEQPCSSTQRCSPIQEPELVDPIVCPILAVVLPPDGDVDGVWNCPPY